MTKLESQLQEMHETLMSITDDVEKFQDGNKSAGTRIRKSMQIVKTLAQMVRVHVQEVKNSEPATV
tara:strand:+ start:162 stop:359 length:198 start_codon:yes stop_codon:yes gene_type:complete